MHAAIYTRVSTDEQAADGYSLAAQERACRLYCELHGHTVGQVYCDDGYSGTTAQRPAFQQLLAELGHYSLVVVHKLDRWARNTRLALDTIEQVSRAGVGFVSVSEQIDLASPTGRMFLTLLAAFGQYYSDNLAAETTKGLAEKARGGGWVGGAPFGYERTPAGLHPSPDAHVVQLIFDRYSTGAYGTPALAAWLNERGHTMRSTTHERIPFRWYHVRAILSNTAYLGFVHWHGHDLPGQHPAIVDAELFQRCQQIRQERGRGGRGGTERNPALLSNIAHCGLCDAKMYVVASGTTAKRYFYYQCRNHISHLCSNRRAPLAGLHDQVYDLLGQLALPEEWQTKVLELAAGMAAQRHGPPPADIEQRLTRLGLAYADGLVDDDTYQRRRDQLRQQLQQAAQPTPAWDAAAAMHLLESLPALLQETDSRRARDTLAHIFKRLWVVEGAIIAVQPTPLVAPMYKVACDVRDNMPQHTSMCMPPVWESFAA
jgi:site-specific DNA recombinase